MKIAIVSGASKKDDSVRGIGVHTSELFKAFRKDSNKEITDPNLSLNDDFSKFDVVHFTVFRPFFVSLPFFKPKGTKFVLTIHDMHLLIYPDHFPPGIKGTVKFLINKFLVWKNIDQIITISETSKKDICRFLGVDPKIVTVVYLGPKEEHKQIKKGKWEDEVKKKYKLPNEFVYYLGDINFNKNIPNLVRACKLAKIKLVMTGKQVAEIENTNLNHPENSHLLDVYEDLINSDVVIRTGFSSDVEANQMMNLALCTIQPSFYEGFGLSIIHAFASGCPVIAGKTQALVEVGADACLYFDPNKASELAEKINLFKNSQKLRNEYIKKGFEQVKKYSWEKAARETLDVYAKA